MKQGMDIRIILVLILAALLVNAFLLVVGSGERAGSVIDATHGQRVSTDRYFLLSDDSYIITTDATGQNIYLYFFERGPKKEESKLFFLTKKRAD